MKERLGYHQHRPWRQTHPSRYVRYRRGGRPQRRGRRQTSVYDAYSPDGPPQQRQHRARAARDQHERRGLCRQATQGQRHPFRPSPDRSAEQSAAHSHTAALFEEYRHLCTVSHLRGFPRVYGYGSCEDDPLILMEWVEGTSLKQALPLLPHDASGGLTTQMVAAVGNAVLRALLMTQGLVNPVIHRDLSPANIMFRTTSRTLEQQIADCSFDPCLIDMGSATMALGDDTITRRADIWRFATPAYAAPEMLTQDIEGIAALRRSPAIDVYALSSIHQLYSGRKPFDFESTDAAATGSIS
ncbi:MAG: protein kinase domain-containing protein [Collinsella aerofaciens]